MVPKLCGGGLMLRVAPSSWRLRTAGFLNMVPFVWQSVKQSNNDS